MNPPTTPEPNEGKGGWLLPTLIILAVLAAGASALVSLSATKAPSKNLAATVSIPLVDFRLTSQDGSHFARSDMAGQIWVINFVFTRCPGPCLELSRKMLELTTTLEKEKSVQFASVTVDPEFDNPEVLTNYAKMLGADLSRWIFLTGPKADVYQLVQKGFLLPVEELEEPNEEGPIAHSTRFVLVDREGRIRGFFDGLIPESRDKLVRSVRALAAEKPLL